MQRSGIILLIKNDKSEFLEMITMKKKLAVLGTLALGTTGIVFKHPCLHYDSENLKKWYCGYILGTILMMKEI